MRTGTIESEPTLDWEGDTLVADADTGDTVLFVDSAIDFDDDDSQTRWLVIADSEPLEYVDVDTAANAVTLADPLVDDYEADLPVVMWDPTVGESGAKVQEYRTRVLLADGTGSPTVTIPHTLIPLNGVANLVGASVGIAERRGEWYVDEVYGREALIAGFTVDVDTIPAPAIARFTLSATESVGDSTWQRVGPWATEGAVHPDIDATGAGPGLGRIYFAKDGVFLFRASARFASSGTGTRIVRIVRNYLATSTEVMAETALPAVTGRMQPQIVGVVSVDANADYYTVEVYQSSGGNLDLLNTDLTDTHLTITRLL